MLEGSAAALPFEEGVFDLVTAFETVYFWPDIEECFRGVRRTLKAGGRFVCLFTFDNDTGLGTPPRALREKARQAGFENVAVKILRAEGSYLLIGDKPC